MIIVSQNKHSIINLNNIEGLTIDFLGYNTIHTCCWNIKVINTENDYSIGAYETEERAKEVLKEIAERYREVKIGYCGQHDYTILNQINIPIFEMPQE